MNVAAAARRAAQERGGPDQCRADPQTFSRLGDRSANARVRSGSSIWIVLAEPLASAPKFKRAQDALARSLLNRATRLRRAGAGESVGDSRFHER